MSDAQPAPLNDGTIQQDQDFWFNDGNIVIIAQVVAFRVHMSVMARHSDVFAGLFAVPQPPPHGIPVGMFDDVPSVHVSDTSYDIRMLMRALYGMISIFDPDSNIRPIFPELAGLARMSHKYQISNLLETVTRRFKQIFPTTFSSWGDIHSFNAKHYAVEAVNLFRLLDDAELLEPALYVCRSLPVHQVVYGMQRVDGTREQLAPADIELCLDLHHHLLVLNATLVLRFVTPFRASPESSCPNPDMCSRVIDERLLRDVRQYASLPSSAFMDGDPLDHTLLNRIGPALHNSEVCESCMKELRERAYRPLLEVWNALPRLMGISAGGLD